MRLLSRMSGTIAGCICMLAPVWAHAEVALLGDVNRDRLLDAADLVAMVEVLADVEAASPEQRTFADADGDGTLSEADVDYLREVLLANEAPRMAVVQFDGMAVSYWKPEPAPSATEEDVLLESAVSFWKPPLPPAATEADTVTLGAASFWKSPVVPPATEEDVVVLGNPSFRRE